MKQLSIFIILSILFIDCGDSDTKEYRPKYIKKINKDKVYIFSVHPLHNPQRLFEVYQPLIDYLNKNISDAKFKLEASRNYASYNKKLYQGKFDFSLPNPYQTVQSLKFGYKVFGKMGDDKNFKGIILVRKDSGIDDVKDLKGKVVSYPAPTALAATMMPQWYLYKHGLDINKDITNSYVGSQESSIMNVFLKKSDAASTWPPPWKAFIKERPEVANEVKVIWSTDFLPNNGLVVRKDIPDEIVKKVSKLLFTLHKTEFGRSILKPMELSKFEKADATTYQPVIEFLYKFDKEVRDIGFDDEN